LIERAETTGVKYFFVPGVTGFPARIGELAEFPQIITGWGVHPGYTEDFHENCCEEMAIALKASVCRAIGECGLDRRFRVKFEKQLAAFQWQIDLARESGLPLVLHLVGHYDVALKMLKQAGPKLKFVLHSFCGSYEVASQFLELDAYISFSGSIFKKNHDDIDRILNLVPENRLLIETDSPDQKPDFCPGKLNEPINLPEIARRLAAVRGISFEELCSVTLKNCRILFMP
jgi:TatD DNase family protein